MPVQKLLVGLRRQRPYIRRHSGPGTGQVLVVWALVPGQAPACPTRTPHCGRVLHTMISVYCMSKGMTDGLVRCVALLQHGQDE